MRLLAIFLLCSVSAFAVCPTGKTCGDQYIRLNNLTAGTAITTAAQLNSGTAGATPGWGAPTASSNASATAHTWTQPCPLSINGTSFTTADTPLGFTFSPLGQTKIAANFPPSTTSRGIYKGFLTIPTGVTATGSDLLDLIRVDGNGAGSLCVLQYNITNLNLGLEKTVGGTAHTTYQSVSPGSTVYYIFDSNVATGGACRLALFNPTTFAQLGSLQSIAANTNDTILQVDLGNDEFGTASGALTFEGTVFDWSAADTSMAIPSCTSTPVAPAAGIMIGNL